MRDSRSAKGRRRPDGGRGAEPPGATTSLRRAPTRAACASLVALGYRALLAVPLVREEQLIGGLRHPRKTPGEFPPEVVELLQTFATQSALAIQNARLFRRSRTRAGSSKSPASTSPSSWRTCPTSCGRR